MIILGGEEFITYPVMPDLFKVSRSGKVYSKRSKKILKQNKHKNGYMTIATRVGGRLGKAYCFKVHRLVAETYLDNIENKPQVNHIDGVKDNNNLSNLEWVTAKENIQHAFRTGLAEPLRGEDSPTSVLTISNVKFIRSNYKPYCRDFGANALGRKFSVSHETIGSVVRGETWNSVL